MSLTNDLVKAMVDIRDQDRVECGRYLFERLGHNDSAFITESQLDELLFMTVRKRLGTSIYADMLLMAFGLLPGYEYENLTIGKRREKFLRESNWLKVNKKSKIENYDSASKEELESVLKSLRNVERHWMKQIANELISDVFHEFFGETCPYCGKWYFSKRKAFRCCEHTALAKLNKKRGQEALAKRRKERRNGTYWRRSAPLIDNDPLSSSSTLPPVIHYCSICGNAYTGAFCNICGNPSDPPY